MIFTICAACVTGPLWVLLGIWSCGVLDGSLLHSHEWGQCSSILFFDSFLGFSCFMWAVGASCCNCMLLSWIVTIYFSSSKLLRLLNVVYQSVSLSENDLLACCGFECGYGCEGGYPIRAWQYFKRTGVVTNKVSFWLLFCACQLPLYILNHSKGCNIYSMLEILWA